MWCSLNATLIVRTNQGIEKKSENFFQTEKSWENRGFQPQSGKILNHEQKKKKIQTVSSNSPNLFCETLHCGDNVCNFFTLLHFAGENLKKDIEFTW